MPERKLPSPVYAAAGAGEAVVEQLKKLPNRAEELRDRSKLEERAGALRDSVTENVKQGVDTLKHLDRDSVRSAAVDAATTVGERAREARERARDTYAEFVERGEHVVAGERGPIKVISTVAKEDATSQTADKVDDAKAEATAKAKPTTKPQTSAKTSSAKKPAAKKTAKKATSAK